MFRLSLLYLIHLRWEFRSKQCKFVFISREILTTLSHCLFPLNLSLSLSRPKVGAPEPYNFNFDVKDDYGNNQFRREESDSTGTVRGSYGYTDANGVYRIVDYVADDNGFRGEVTFLSFSSLSKHLILPFSQHPHQRARSCGAIASHRRCRVARRCEAVARESTGPCARGAVPLHLAFAVFVRLVAQLLGRHRFVVVRLEWALQHQILSPSSSFLLSLILFQFPCIVESTHTHPKDKL